MTPDELIGGMEMRTYEAPVEEAIYIIEEYLSSQHLGFWYSKDSITVHIHRFNDYVGMVCLFGVLYPSRIDDYTKVKVVRFPSDRTVPGAHLPWDDEETRAFDLYDPDSLPNIAKYVKSWRCTDSRDGSEDSGDGAQP